MILQQTLHCQNLLLSTLNLLIQGEQQQKSKNQNFKQIDLISLSPKNRKIRFKYI